MRSQEAAWSGAPAKLHQSCNACRTCVNRSALTVGNTSNDAKAQNHLDTIGSEVLTLIKEHSLPPHRMPTHKQIRLAGRQDLSEAIYRAGGTRKVAAQLNLQSSGQKSFSSKTPAALQSCRATIEQIEAFCQEHQIPPDRMPTLLELKQRRRCRLLVAIQANGGVQKLAPLTGRQIRQPHRGHLQDFAEVVLGVHAFVRDQHPGQRRMPTCSQLASAGQQQLSYSVTRHGFQKVANEAGLDFGIISQVVSLYLQQLMHVTAYASCEVWLLMHVMPT